MKQVVVTLTLLVLTLSVAPACAWAAADSAVSGVVRDTHGIPQMGALVELMAPDASIVAQAFTDDHGRYLLNAVLPGSYQLRASAAFLLPVVRGNLRIRSGARSIADLTMTAIFEVGAWLPTERRTLREPSDDWRWTLRSTANRPLLRLADDQTSGSSTVVSSSAEHPQAEISEGELALTAGDGSFGQGGAHQVITMDRAGVDGGVSVLRANLGDGPVSRAGNSFVLAAGMEKQRPFGGGTRLFFSVESHPELQTAAGGGLEVLRSATTQKIVLGDAFIVDAGTLLTAERLLGNRFSSAPYVRVAFRPSSDLSFEYRLATDRSLQRTEDLDDVVIPEETLSDAHGRPLRRTGLHQELVAAESQEKHVISVAVYRDVLPAQGVQGGGAVGQQDLGGLPVITDPTTGTLRVALQGFSGDGVRVAWSQTLSPALSACVEGEFGKAVQANGSALRLQELDTAVQARTAAALQASVRAEVRRTGSTVNVRYRWQTAGSLTQVDQFDAAPEDAFLGVTLKQRLWSGRRLKGLNAVVEATNLLAQGYEPLLGSDGQTLFLAQVPRGVLGGLTFSF